MTELQATKAYLVIQAAKYIEDNPSNHQMYDCLSLAMSDYLTEGGTLAHLCQLMMFTHPNLGLKTILEQGMALGGQGA